MSALVGPHAYTTPEGTPVEAVGTPLNVDRSEPQSIPDAGQSLQESAALQRTPSRKALGSSPNLFSAKAAIMSHETRSDDKRFTVS